MRLFTISLALLLASHSALAECRYQPVADLTITYSWPGLQPLIEGSVNGMPASLMFNTGSFNTFLTSRGALSRGLKPTLTRNAAFGVSGMTSIYSAFAQEFVIGPSRGKNVEVAVLADTAHLEGYDGMVGADYATQLDLEIAIADKKLRFFHASDCEQTWLGYWDQDAIVVPYFNAGWTDKRPRVTVALNGKKMVAVVDTAASHTVVYRTSAERAGIVLDTDAQKSGSTSGLGRKKVQTWAANFEFKLGDETVKNARLQIIDMPNTGIKANEEDMLLGQDWLRRHRILLSQHQKKAYFSYLGGALFGDGSDAPWFKADADAGVGTAQLAMARYDKEQGRQRESDGWMQKALAGGDPNASYMYGTQLVVRRQFAQAVPLLQTTLKKQPDNIQAALWLYLAQQQAEGEQQARSTLAALPPARGEWWYALIIDFYLGKANAGDTKARAQAKGNPRHACEVERFIGLQEVLKDGGAKTGNRDWSVDWCQNALPGAATP